MVGSAPTSMAFQAIAFKTRLASSATQILLFNFQRTKNLLQFLAPREGIEPPTYWLTASCSTVELPENTWMGRKASNLHC